MENYLQQLNEQQRAAVVYTDGPQLIVAGAGSGKTRALTYKIVHLLHEGYRPHQILALTFTNKAAKEMLARIKNLVGEEQAAKLWMGTFHSIFAKILRLNADKIHYKSDYTIYDATDSTSVIKHIVKDMGLDDKTYKASALQARISMLKNSLISPTDYAKLSDFIEEDKRHDRPLFASIYQLYWNRCRTAGAMDFDDILYNTNVLLRDNDDVRERYKQFFQYILIDEYQDTNFAQDMIVYQLCKDHQHMCAVGDDAQSIYSFRGARIDNILNLKKRYPTLQIFRLEQNYRSTQNITAAANSLIEKNKGQIQKHLFSENEPGNKIKVIRCSTDYEEAYVVANTISRLKRQQGSDWSDFAVLYRANSQSRIIEKALTSGGLKDDHGHTRMAIPYRIYGGVAFYQRKEVKDAICYLRMALNPDDDEALRRVINYPTRGIGATTLEKIQKCAIAANVSMWQVIMRPGVYGLKVNKGTLQKLDGFRNLIVGIITFNNTGVTAYEAVREIIERAELIKVLATDNTPENISRQENLVELVNSAKEFVESKREELGDDDLSLTSYMAEVALATDQDTDGETGPCVTLMTVHAAKGLEYKNVIIAGAEEDYFPSYKSVDTLAGIEEERRLMYVAITRAEKNCVIVYADSHVLNGKPSQCNPSRFIMDIDPQYLSMAQTSFTTDSYQRTPRRETRTVESSQPTARVNAPVPKPTTPPPHFTSVHRALAKPASTTPASGKDAQHNAAELQEGMRIRHSRFGLGTITLIDTAADAKITVQFDNVGSKKLLLAFAKFEILQ